MRAHFFTCLNFILVLAATNTLAGYVEFDGTQSSHALNADGETVVYRLPVSEYSSDSADFSAVTSNSWDKRKVLVGYLPAGDGISNVACNSLGVCLLGSSDEERVSKYLNVDVWIYDGTDNMSLEGGGEVSPMVNHQNGLSAVDLIGFIDGIGVYCTDSWPLFPPESQITDRTLYQYLRASQYSRPGLGVHGENLMTSGTNVTEHEGQLQGDFKTCLFRSGLIDPKLHCWPHPADFPPPFHAPVFSDQKHGDGHYQANAVVLNWQSMAVLSFSQRDMVENVRVVLQKKYDGVLTPPVKVLTANSGFMKKSDYADNVQSAFFLEQGQQVVVHAVHTDFSEPVSAVESELSVTGMTLPDEIVPGVLVGTGNSKNRPAEFQDIHLFYTTQEGVWHFSINSSGDIIQSEMVHISAVKGFDIKSSFTHVNGDKLVVLLKSDTHTRIESVPLSHFQSVDRTTMYSYRKSLGSDAEFPGIQVITPFLSEKATGIPTREWQIKSLRWTLAWITNNGTRSLINDDCGSSDTICHHDECGIPFGYPVYPPNNNQVGVKANHHGDITVSNRELQACIDIWRDMPDDEEAVLRVMYHAGDGWSSAGMEFRIKGGSDRDREDYLWKLSDSEWSYPQDIQHFGFSSIPLHDGPGGDLGCRRLVLGHPYDPKKIGGLSTGAIIGIAVGGFVIVAVVVTGVAYLIYRGCSGHIGYQPL